MPDGPAELMLMLLSDARLPTGAHTQSAGLEPAINAGLPPADVPAYIRARLTTVTAVEAGAAVVARHRALGADPTPGLRGVDRAWRARTISPALRETSVLLGRGYQRLVARLWPRHRAVIALGAVERPGRAVVLGVAAACAGLNPAQLARLIGYDEAQTIAAAALKIAPLDPLEATAWVIGAQPVIERMAAGVAGLTEPDQIPAFGAPLIEQWAEIHSTTTQRLFRA
ncbi:urease accessory protein [Nakamurella panacisegetis]|uniref:Urease accessory protein n=1 Tax=Nakamurella panacisegetis TaxID=1090615 RepID=A0A1H0K515_9ACTN|nr:urease accessory UreF family protein [Nakamurella panacisegetis]SDO50957.1 urease accessory protein [Nakamurella panacisegetis]